MTHAGEDLGFVFPEPGELGDGERRDGHAARVLRPVRGAELVDEALRLRRRLGVVPQLRRTEHLALLVEDDHPVLLARHTDGADIVRMAVEE